MTITQKQIISLFDYRDGELYWKESKAKCIKIGDLAGCVNPKGYRRIAIDGKYYYAHRLIFLYHHGYLPEFLDHIDCDKSNNSIDNLREATKSQNNMNRKKVKSMNGKPTSSDYKGACWDKHAKKWVAKIQIGGKLKHLGFFDSEIEAAKAYYRAAIETRGDFARSDEIIENPR